MFVVPALPSLPALCLLLALTSAVHGAVSITLHSIYGYIILQDILGIVSWVVAIAIVYHERHRPISIGSHGIPLVVWLLNGVWESFQLLGWSNPHWWWSLHCTTDIANLTLYFIRSVLVSGVISVGVVWPLCTRKAPSCEL